MAEVFLPVKQSIEILGASLKPLMVKSIMFLCMNTIRFQVPDPFPDHFGVEKCHCRSKAIMSLGYGKNMWLGRGNCFLLRLWHMTRTSC